MGLAPATGATGTGKEECRPPLPQCCSPSVVPRQRTGCGRRECKMQNIETAPRAPKPQRLKSTTWELRRACTGPAPDPPAATKACAQEPIDRQVRSQVSCPQRLTRPFSDRFRASSVLLPVYCRRRVCSPRHIGSVGLPKSSSTLAHIRQSAHSRELWRGG